MYNVSSYIIDTCASLKPLIVIQELKGFLNYGVAARSPVSLEAKQCAASRDKCRNITDKSK
jgi:hypothetical protein